MVDRRRIVRQWRQGDAKALVTLVRAEGSSYRRPGAHLLIGAEGAWAGTISGGCLEAEVVRKAAWMVRHGALVERYSTLFDDTAEIPFGLGCGGVVDLLIEPAETAEYEAMLAAMEASIRGVEMVVATWLPEAGRRLARVVWDAGGAVVFASDGLGEDEIASIHVTNPPVQCGTDDAGVYVERLAAPQRLFVLGAGDDARPVVTMAAMLGWRVTVADGRAQLARAERFPEAEHVVVAASVDGLGVRDGDAAVVMSHSYEQDRAILTGLLAGGFRAADTGRGGARYIGLLGAAHRSSLLVSEAAAALGRSVAECCERVHAPVGLDLGGDGPEAIALAVVAQVQAWRQGRLGESRRLTAEDVAAHVAEGGAARYVQAQCVVGAAETART
jgi:xanthine/CO dehydrogenase XdhC/CoxF family maturation factor